MTLYYISLVSIISEMREQITTRFVVIPVNSYALARCSLVQSPMHLLGSLAKLMASITKETLEIPRCKCNARSCAQLALGAFGLAYGIALPTYIHPLAQVLALQQLAYNSP